MEDIEKLAQKYNIKILYNKDRPKDEPLINDCCLYGNDTICIGEYTNKELLFISFFHELGHTLVSEEFRSNCNYNTLMIELEAWNKGIKLALSMSYLFSDKALKWAYREKALSYVGHDERECRDWEKNDKPKLWKEKQNI